MDRVIVMSIKDMSRVRIFFIDNGIILTVFVSSLRYLPSQLSRLPAQAIPVSLALPASLTSWPGDSGARLKQLLIDSK